MAEGVLVEEGFALMVWTSEFLDLRLTAERVRA
jgi:hypothetical protein